MRILHTGDLHLDSPFCASNALVADKRRAMQRETLGRIFGLASSEGCDMVLIAGDLFDSKYVTPETQKYVLELFASVSIPVVVSPGNHDPYINGSFYRSGDFSDNVYIFSSSELQCFDFPSLGARVFGYAFTSAAMSENPLNGQTPAENDGYINLLCAHADLSSVISRYCPLTVKDILNFGIDYAALGHIHNRYDEGFSGVPNIRYCGFPEGRSFDELGDGGVFVVDVEKGMPVSVRRHAVSSQSYEISELDISDCGRRSEVAEKIKAEIDKVSAEKKVHLRIILQGTAEAPCVYALDALEKELAEDLLSLEIKNLTVPVENIASLKTDISIRGAFYNALYAGLTDEDPSVRARNVLALQIGLAAIDGRRIPGGKDEI